MSTRAYSYRRLILLSVIALVAAPRPALSAWPHDPTLNVALAPAAGNQTYAVGVPDGAGGMILTWPDYRGGASDIYAQCITASGTIAPGWPTSGLAVCNATDDQFEPVAVSDGLGGAIIAWTDARTGGASNRDIYAMRVNADGTLGAGWPANGRLLSATLSAKDETSAAITTDGAGGAIVVWQLTYDLSDYDIYAARVSSGGAVAWSGGMVTPGGVQDNPHLVSDGAGGAVLCYEDAITGNSHIKAVGISGAGSYLWGPVSLSSSLGNQASPALVTDGAGGAIVAWTDLANSGDVYVSRVTNSGSVAVGWAFGGEPIAALSGLQGYPALASDGNHGALIAWNDTRNGGNDLYVQHMLSVGQIAPGWPNNGVEVGPNQTCNELSIVSDGSGGAVVSWSDFRDGGYHDIYASRITTTGALGAGWTYAGTPISVGAYDQRGPVAMSMDGSGGVILAWSDWRAGGYSNIFAQRVDLFGKLGNAEPTLASIRDVKGDQGGHVRLTWNASYLDADPTYAIGAYWIWRQAPVTAAVTAVAAGGRWLDARLEAIVATASPADRSEIARHGLFTTTVTSGTTYAWEYLASQPASGFSQYSYVAETTRDSLGGSNPYTPFMVQARAPSGPAFWSSAPDSGYSVDNLPPSAPASFTDAYVAGATHLHWGVNLEVDLAGYNLYRGSSADFVPGPANLISAQPDTGYTDNVAPAFYYKLSAVDAHGNWSPFALLAPMGTLDVQTVNRPAELSLALASANPARDGAMLRLALPQEATLELAVFDVRGRLVSQLAKGKFAAGERVLRWDGRDASGTPAPSGVYFVRLRAGGDERTTRLALAR